MIEITDIDSKFKLLNAFELTVPGGYDHDTQLASFSEKHKKEFDYYNYAITDKNFARASNRLVPGKTYTVKIFAINQRVGSKDCLEFLQTQDAVFVGAQGISLAWQCRKEEFPINKWVVSFDKEDALWENVAGYRFVPHLLRHSGGVWYFYLGLFEDDWDDGHCLLCFCLK